MAAENEIRARTEDQIGASHPNVPQSGREILEAGRAEIGEVDPTEEEIRKRIGWPFRTLGMILGAVAHKLNMDS